ncbi:MAG: alpha/beta fold hydrolase [Anaerolineae bacterium]
MYCQLLPIREIPAAVRSPIIFIHGFPDSPEIFADYHTPHEQAQDWLQGRNIYAIEFPNRHTRPNFPPLLALISGQMRCEFAEHLTHLIADSPTGQVIPIAHDLGATYTWRYIRQQGGAGIERFVSLSVGSSFRYDIWEHGASAITWLYSLIYILPYYLPFAPFRRMLAQALTQTAGYQSDSAEKVYQDVFHYWYAPLWLVRFPIFFIPLPDYTAFDFPVLFIRSEWDRIASTNAFERTLAQRADSRVLVWEEVTHWFPEQQSQRVLTEIRSFLHG